LHMQVKLLRVIQEKAVRPIGGRDEVPVDVRILSATHKNLEALVANNTFRQDLYYRINVIELHMPALRARREDVPLLAARVLERLAGGSDAQPKLTPAALAALNAYDFPGNVRELENILERAIALCENGVIEAGDLRLAAQPPRTTSNANMSTSVDAEDEDADDSSNSPVHLDEYISQIERETIEKALLESRYNKTATAKKLGITFRALRYKLKKLGID
jgi:two-component system response regulator PilR (NtrC family)